MLALFRRLISGTRLVCYSSETLQYVVRDRIDPSEMDRSGNRGALIRACQAAEAEAQSAA